MSRLDVESDRLMASCLAGVALPDEVAELNVRMAADTSLVDEYVRLMRIEAALQWQHGGLAVPAMTLPAPRASLWQSRRVPILATAALITLLVMAWFVLWSRESASVAPMKPSRPQMLATLTSAENVSWRSEPFYEGQDVAAGTIRMASGFAGFLLTSGTQVGLAGATEIHLKDSMHVGLTQGRARFTCPPDARGFTVLGPGGLVVVDLGTQFEMAVDEHSGRVRVHVTQGLVQVRTSEQAIVAIEPLDLTADQMLEYDPIAGHVVRLGVPVAPRVSGAVTWLDDPPASVQNDRLTDDTTMFAFLERAAVKLDSDLVTPHGKVAAGTLVDVYLLHKDATGLEDVELEGAIQFDRPILAAIDDTALLGRTDPTLGSPYTRYDTLSIRGLESGADRIDWSPERNAVSVRWVGYGPDDLRLIVAHQTSGTTVQVQTNSRERSK
ncbi:hypothetical protein HED60_06390 [Planctomycetales bacterium ZRK34]|nr:hypothetical protein HED60_06390 [Planctomycetales bacterium ZRK34]